MINRLATVHFNHSVLKTPISPLKLLLLLVALSVAPGAWSQSDQWAWLKGARTPNSKTQYGSAASRPSARNAWGATWQTADGLIWMFGGYGKDARGNTGA